MFNLQLTAELIDAGNLVEAEQLCRSALQSEPGYALPYLMLALVARARGADDEQLGYLHQAAGAQPKLPDVYLLLSQAYFARSLFREALLMAVAALQLDPSHQGAVATLHQQLAQLGPARLPSGLFDEYTFQFPGEAVTVAAPPNPRQRLWMNEVRQALQKGQPIPPRPALDPLDNLFLALFWQSLHATGDLPVGDPAGLAIFPLDTYQSLVFDPEFALGSRSDVLLRLTGEEQAGWIDGVYHHYLLPTIGAALQRADQTTAIQLAFWAFVSYGSLPHTAEQWRRVSADIAGPLQAALAEFRQRVAPQRRRNQAKSPPQHFGFVTELSISVSSGDLMMADLMRALAALPEIKVTLFVTEYWSVSTDTYLDSLRAAGVQVRHLIDIAEGVPLTDFLPRSRALQKAFAVDQIDTLIFVGVSEPKALFLGSCGLAPRQIYFSLGFPYVDLPAEDWDGYMCGSRVQPSWPEGKWWSYPPYRSDPQLAETYPQRLEQAQAIRNYLAGFGDVILGSIARADKLRNAEFIDVLQGVLQRHPEALFVWCGAAVEDPQVRRMMVERGISERCPFAGWVDGQVYANVLDIHLDVFPFPSGLSMMDTLSAGRAFAWYDAGEMSRTMSSWATTWKPVATGELGTPADQAQALVAFIDPETGLSLAPIAASKEAYIDHICNLIEHPQRRTILGQAGRTFMQRTVHNPNFAVGEFLKFVAAC